MQEQPKRAEVIDHPALAERRRIERAERARLFFAEVMSLPAERFEIEEFADSNVRYDWADADARTFGQCFTRADGTWELAPPDGATLLRWLARRKEDKS